MRAEFDLINYFKYAIDRKRCLHTENKLRGNNNNLVLNYYRLYEKELSDAGLTIEDIQRPSKKFLDFISTYTFPLSKREF